MFDFLKFKMYLFCLFFNDFYIVCWFLVEKNLFLYFKNVCPTVGSYFAEWRIKWEKDILLQF